jgi:hypothetical protein
MCRHQPAGSLHTGGYGALGPYQDDVHWLSRIASQQLIAVCHAVDPGDAWDRGHHSSESLADASPVVADENCGHGRAPFLQPSDVPTSLIGRAEPELDTI